MTTASGYSIPVAAAADDERHQRQAGGQRGHQDRRQPLLGAAQDQLAAERLAFLVFQVAVVADQHDAVAGGDAEHRHEADQRAERQHAAGQERRRRRRRPARTAASANTSSVSRADAEVDVAAAGRCRPATSADSASSAPRRRLPRGVLAEDLGVVAAARTTARRARASMSRATAPRSRPAHVAGDVDPARAALALDLVRRRHDRRRRPRRPSGTWPPRRRVDRQRAERVEVVAHAPARPRRPRRRSSAPRRPRRPSCPAPAWSTARRTSPGVSAEPLRRARAGAAPRSAARAPAARPSGR